MLRSIFSKPYSKLYIVGDNSGWSVDEDAKDLKGFAEKLGIKAKIIKKARLNIPQAVHYTSQFSLQYNIYKNRHKLSVDYYHGNPEKQESFRKCFEALKEHHEKISRVRVSNREMEALIKSSGIDEGKVMRIPLGIDLNIFKSQTENSKPALPAGGLKIRNSLGIPQDTVVIGSFQKDGVGWGEGNEPKLIKGPDIFLEVISRLKSQIPNLWVLLSGPARGFVKNGLEKIGVPYRHKFLENADEISDLYDALDLYLITSREEGGPKACLQAMAKKVPLVTTEVGQCKDLVVNGKNAKMAAQEDVDTLTEYALEMLLDEKLRDFCTGNALVTAQENSFDSQLPKWREYMSVLVQ